MDRARLVVADAGIDDDAPLVRLDDEAVDRSEQTSVLVREMRPEPGVAADQFRRCLRKHEGARKRRAAQFGHAGDFDVADLPTQECVAAHIQSPTARSDYCLKSSAGRLQSANRGVA